MNKKYIYAAMAAAAVVFCGTPVAVDLIENYRFNQCLSEHGVNDYRSRQNAVTLVTLYAGEGSSYVGIDFSNPNMGTSGPYFIDEKKKRTPFRRMSPRQVEVVNVVDDCRRGGFLAAIYSRIGMVQPKNDG